MGLLQNDSIQLRLKLHVPFARRHGNDALVFEDDSARARRAGVVRGHLQFHSITFPKGQRPLQTCLQLVRVQSHASTPVRTLQIPNTGSRTIVSTHEQILHTLVGLGNLALAGFLCLTRLSQPEFSRMGQ